MRRLDAAFEVPSGADMLSKTCDSRRSMALEIVAGADMTRDVWGPLAVYALTRSLSCRNSGARPAGWQRAEARDALQVFRIQAGVFGNAGEHFGPNFLPIMECPRELTFGGVCKLNVRGPFLGLQGPTGPEKGAEDFASFGAGPATQGWHAIEMSSGLSF